MFKNVYPVFVNKKVLRIETLEDFRDYPRNMFEILYQKYCNGILAGCEITVRNDDLILSPGILRYRNKFFTLDSEEKVSFEATGKLSYLKVKFLDKISGISQEELLTQIYIDGETPDERYEIELARFKLQPGARLRDAYTDFFDYDTEFDTLNQIHAPHAALGKNNISPEILKCFAKTLMGYPVKNSWDVPFAMNCLHLREAMPYEEIHMYLNMRLQKDQEEYTNIQIYNYLCRILLEARGKESVDRKLENSEKKLLLL